VATYQGYQESTVMAQFDPPPFDLSNLMKQAQALQEKFKQTQDEVAERTVEAASGGGMIQVIVDGAMRVRSIQIDPALLAANDREMLQDLIAVAINAGLQRAQEMVTQEMSKLAPMGGLNLPGLFGGRG
jgi:DNA-binding YbaB/EbfC family protein